MTISKFGKEADIVYSVSPVIVLEVAENYDPSYLSTQLFAGFMYVGSALFAWALRCWKLDANLGVVGTRLRVISKD